MSRLFQPTRSQQWLAAWCGLLAGLELLLYWLALRADHWTWVLVDGGCVLFNVYSVLLVLGFARLPWHGLGGDS
jgi:hypothetical protein